MTTNSINGNAGGQGQIPNTKPALTIGTVSGDDRVNAMDSLQGVRVAGTSTPFAMIRLQWGGTFKNVQTDAAGNWSATFARGEVPSGNEVRTQISAQVVGNPTVSSAPVTRSVLVDTVPPAKPVIHAVTGEDKINIAEATLGVKITGTAEARAQVEVRWGSVTKMVQTDSRGNWIADFTSKEVLGNQTAKVITATAIDASGNSGPTAVRTGPAFDLQAPMAPIVHKISGDGHVTLAEAKAGVEISGWGEPGATVVVQWGGHVRTVTAPRSGEWTVRFEANQVVSLVPGQTDVTVKVIDAIGNVSPVVTQAVTVDLPIRPKATATEAAAADVVDLQAGVAGAMPVAGPDDGPMPIAGQGPVLPTRTTIKPVAGEDMINAVEMSGGVLVAGTADASGVVRVQWGKTQRFTKTDAEGKWSIAFGKNEIPQSQDAQGLPSVIKADVMINGVVVPGSQTARLVLVDTVAPTAPSLTVDTRITQAEAALGVPVQGKADAYTLVQVQWGAVNKTVRSDGKGEWRATFDAAQIGNNDVAEKPAVVSAKAVDMVGNFSGEARQVVWLDGKAPIKPPAPPEVPNTPIAPVKIQAVTGDDRVLAAEAAKGVVVTGTAEAGRWVQVDWGTASKKALTDAAGNWKAGFDKGEVPVANGKTLDVSAQFWNANPAEANPVVKRSVLVDTVAPMSPVFVSVAGDGKINASEAASGFAVKGMTDPNTQVKVSWGGASHETKSDATGSWAMQFTKSDVPGQAGEKSFLATAVDQNGNVSELGRFTAQVDLSAPIRPFVLPVTGDNVVTFAEAIAGVKVSGFAEPKTGVNLAWGEFTRTVSVDDTGRWTAIVRPDEILRGKPGNVSLSAEVVDAVGNVSEKHVQTVNLDFQFPGQAKADAIGMLVDPATDSGAGSVALAIGAPSTLSASFVDSWALSQAVLA